MFERETLICQNGILKRSTFGLRCMLSVERFPSDGPLKRHEVSVHNYKAFGETHSMRQEVSGHDFSRAVRDLAGVYCEA